MGSELGVTPDSKPQPAYTPVSIWWACWAGMWTLAVVVGMAYLIIRRDSPILRIRGLGLSLSAIVLLHLYATSVQFGTMIGAIMPGDAQYWIMGTYLPCGIALFHASNSRFLHVAKLQRKYAHRDSRTIDPSPDVKRKSDLMDCWRSLGYTKKIFILVGIAMFVQVFITVLMWVISRKWHSSWGIPGTEVHGTPMEQATEQGRGWEWWSGVFWQFFWSWVVAPIVLWKSRKIHDTHGWRVQTIGCAIANLHATPLWLIALYVPAMEVVNQYWIPPQWICLSIWIMEIFTVFLPCWLVMRHQSLRKETLDAIAQWESKTKAASAEATSLSSVPTMVESMMSGWKSTNGSVETNTSTRDSIMNMRALEYVLERNPSPLQSFSALHDFSGENVAFLTSVTEWKSSLTRGLWESTAQRDGSAEELIRKHFVRALRIYTEFISVRQAEFPVNISFQDLKRLENIFEGAARMMYSNEREVDLVTPFETPPCQAPPSLTTSESSEKPIKGSASIKSRAEYIAEIPEGFSATVFDAAEESIKYLVLTNTWPKFVRNRRSSTDTSNTLEAGM
ncbi:hypothetical protein BBP40_004077 [Aspergillus hancockii]|nr:hypothetical protein BBP40_004077 [Aspergillus hancockii]